MQSDDDKYQRDTQPISERQIQRLREASKARPEAELEETLSVSNGDVPMNQDEISTPVPIVIPQVNPRVESNVQRSSGMLRVMVFLALVISVMSLALSGVLIFKLLSVRQLALDGLDSAISSLENLGGEGFSYEYRFNQTIPFSGDIPFKQDMVFPFKGDIPINTTVQVPIDAGLLGQFVVDVPINTSFYVDLEVPISVDQTIHVDTEIPLDMVIPINIQPDDPEVKKAIDQILNWLLNLRAAF